MGTFKDSLKKWFYTQGTQAASSGARVPLLDASGNPIGSDTMANLASALEVTMSRRTRLTDFSLSTLQQAVADRNLEKYGLKVGDQKTINGRTYVIAGLNPMKEASNLSHVGLIVIPYTTQKWNASGNTYTGAGGRGAGYINSDLHYYLTNTLLPLVRGDLGSGNLLAHPKLLGNNVNASGWNRTGSASGCTSDWNWTSQYISALSEMQVYGATIWSSSAYDTGEACSQLDVFRRFNFTDIFGIESMWLRDVVSASYAAYTYSGGNAGSDTASYDHSIAALVLFK